MVILFYKRIFLSNSFTFITIWKQTMKVLSWFWRSIKGYKWIIPEWTFWVTKIMCVGNEDVFFVLKVNRMPKMTYFQMTLSKDEEYMCSTFMISWTCRDIYDFSYLWRDFVKHFLLCKDYLFVRSHFYRSKVLIEGSHHYL